MKTLLKIAVVATIVANLSSCDWITSTHPDKPDSDSLVVPIDTTKGIVVIDSIDKETKTDTATKATN